VLRTDDIDSLADYGDTVCAVRRVSAVGLASALPNRSGSYECCTVYAYIAHTVLVILTRHYRATKWTHLIGWKIYLVQTDPVVFLVIALHCQSVA